MKYSYNNLETDKYRFGDVQLKIEPEPFDKNSGKEILQYAVGGLLYMPASNTAIADKIINGEYWFIKSMVLDLEDSLGDDLVGFGKDSIIKVMDKLNKAICEDRIKLSDIPLIFIRVREASQIGDIADKLGRNLRLITGFNIPKFDKTNCDKFINEFYKVRQLAKNEYNTDIYIMPILENKNTLYRQLRMENLLYINNKLRKIQDSVLNIRVGGADFCSIYGIRRRIKDDIYDIGVVRSVLNDIVNVFGKSYVISGPVWEYFYNINEPDNNAWRTGLENELYADRLNGFIGKTCIHPSQTIVVQESLIVDYEDYLDAISILGMNSNTTGVKKSPAGNKMNEVKTHCNWARKIIGLARVYGVR